MMKTHDQEITKALEIQGQSERMMKERSYESEKEQASVITLLTCNVPTYADYSRYGYKK